MEKWNVRLNLGLNEANNKDAREIKLIYELKC